MNEGQRVFLIDDDAAIRDSLSLLFSSLDMDCVPFPDAQHFLDEYDEEFRGCLVLDIRMPGMSGLVLQDKLIDIECHLPIIFITGHGDVPMAVQAIRKGAQDFIQKPFRDQELIEAVERALSSEAENYDVNQRRAIAKERLESLTPRERQVCELMLDGFANKQMALKLDISQRTIELHRGKVMEKFEADSLAQVVRDCHLAGLG